MDNKNWPERRQRHRVQLDAELLHGDGTTSKTIVSDLSLEGCRLLGWFLIGDEVTLRLPKIGIVKGKVRWAMNGEAGLRFQPSVEG